MLTALAGFDSLRICSLDLLAGFARGIDSLDSLAGLARWIGSLDSLAGFARWIGSLDSLAGLTRWIRSLDSVAGFARGTRRIHSPFSLDPPAVLAGSARRSRSIRSPVPLASLAVLAGLSGFAAFSHSIRWIRFWFRALNSLDWLSGFNRWIRGIRSLFSQNSLAGFDGLLDFLDGFTCGVLVPDREILAIGCSVP